MAISKSIATITVYALKKAAEGYPVTITSTKDGYWARPAK